MEGDTLDTSLLLAGTSPATLFPIGIEGAQLPSRFLGACSWVFAVWSTKLAGKAATGQCRENPLEAVVLGVYRMASQQGSRHCGETRAGFFFSFGDDL